MASRNSGFDNYYRKLETNSRRDNSCTEGVQKERRRIKMKDEKLHWNVQELNVILQDSAKVLLEDKEGKQ